MREICQSALQISTVPSTAEIFPCTVTRPALPAFCSSVEPTESNDPAYKILLFFLLLSFYALLDNLNCQWKNNYFVKRKM